jgi:hypothetical protein
MADTVMPEDGTTNGTNQHEWFRNRRIRTFGNNKRPDRSRAFPAKQGRETANLAVVP